ncbi:MAG TPA: O-acetyl-ADP-ribose deacetylase [Pyrinomonadaceae bacterium]|nr:O-acetyl-ADP-ribose deacetylase [Pyrinomonadaceae bacterium]
MKNSEIQSFLDGRVVVVVGDITREEVTAIVNAANSSLLGGGGVDGAIHRAGGPQIYNACKEIRQRRYPHGLPTGEAIITTGGNLFAKYVIHTVGPIYGQDPEHESQLLAGCYTNSLKLAREYSISSVAFPSISTGAYGYPKSAAAAISSRAVKESLSAAPMIEQVRLVFFHDADARTFLERQEFE